MKYITPSIEVVNFDRNDAPRVGMQWWYQTENPYGFAPAGSWTPVGTNMSRKDRQVDRTPYGVPCSAVDVYRCYEEVIPGHTPSNVDANGVPYPIVCDDGQSC